MLIAGPTTVLSSKRMQVLAPLKFKDEVLDLKCEWDDCSFSTTDLDDFMGHVSKHIPSIELIYENEEPDDSGTTRVTAYLVCSWKSCPYKVLQSEDLQRHLYLHAYHTKLKCIGRNTVARNKLNACRADPSNCNILPDLSENVVCAWGTCSQKFINIQEYYDHIRQHCMQNPKGNSVPGGIACCWSGCTSSFPNITKLRDHMRSHTQEKLLACPTCGGLFSNRTRFFDHCLRQVGQEDEEEQCFQCSVCMKSFPTLRLLRDHIRCHVNTYRCTMCDMSCSSPSALQAHMKYRHSTDKPFPCSYCTYAAKSQSDLSRHYKTHGNAMYRCEEEGCKFAAKSLTAFNTHWENVHSTVKIQKYVCHVCEKKFLRGYYLTKHLIGVHKLQWPSGHSRFRYKICPDGLYRLLTLRYETAEEEEDEVDDEESAKMEEEEEVSFNDGSANQ